MFSAQLSCKGSPGTPPPRESDTVPVIQVPQKLQTLFFRLVSSTGTFNIRLPRFDLNIQGTLIIFIGC